MQPRPSTMAMCGIAQVARLLHIVPSRPHSKRRGLRSFVAVQDPSEERGHAQAVPRPGLKATVDVLVIQACTLHVGGDQAQARAVDLAVPELRAAFAFAATQALEDVGVNPSGS